MIAETAKKWKSNWWLLQLSWLAAVACGILLVEQSVSIVVVVVHHDQFPQNSCRKSHTLVPSFVVVVALTLSATLPHFLLIERFVESVPRSHRWAKSARHRSITISWEIQTRWPPTD